MVDSRSRTRWLLDSNQPIERKGRYFGCFWHLGKDACDEMTRENRVYRGSFAEREMIKGTETMYELQETESVIGGLQNDLQLLSRRINIAVDDGTSCRSSFRL